MVKISSQPKHTTAGSLRDSLISSINILKKVKKIIDKNSRNFPPDDYSEINNQLTGLISHLSDFDKAKEAKQKQAVTAQELKDKNLRNRQRK